MTTRPVLVRTLIRALEPACELTLKVCETGWLINANDGLFGLLYITGASTRPVFASAEARRSCDTRRRQKKLPDVHSLIKLDVTVS